MLWEGKVNVARRLEEELRANPFFEVVIDSPKDKINKPMDYSFGSEDQSFSTLVGRVGSNIVRLMVNERDNAAKVKMPASALHNLKPMFPTLAEMDEGKGFVSSDEVKARKLLG